MKSVLSDLTGVITNPYHQGMDAFSWFLLIGLLLLILFAWAEILGFLRRP